MKDEARIFGRGVFMLNICIPGAIIRDINVLFTFEGRGLECRSEDTFKLILKTLLTSEDLPTPV